MSAKRCGEQQAAVAMAVPCHVSLVELPQPAQGQITAHQATKADVAAVINNRHVAAQGGDRKLGALRSQAINHRCAGTNNRRGSKWTTFNHL